MTKAEFSPAAALTFVKETARPRDPDAVLAALDEFGWAKAWHMSLGDEKGVILDEALRKVDSLMTVVELGTFVGYSAVRIARLLPPGGKVYTIDPEVERTNAVAKEMVAFAGLADKVEFVPGTAAEALPKLSAREELKGKVDCVFIDHSKDYYLSDLQLIEKLGMLRPGALVVADNVIMNKAKLADYFKHVADKKFYSSTVTREAHVEYTTDVKDGLEFSTWIGQAC